MRWILKEYFTFSSFEVRVCISLGMIILGLLLFRVYYSEKTYMPDEMSPAELIEVYDFIARLENRKRRVGKSTHISGVEKEKLNPVYFDPNTVNENMLQEIGLNNFVIHNLIKFRKNGGRFFSADEFSKIYGLSEEQFNCLKPFIKIDDTDLAEIVTSELKNKVSNNIKGKDSTYLIDINRADTSGFQRIRGIGSVYASRIVKFRELLGGFYSVEQLKEVYGLHDSIVELNRNLFITDKSKIKRIPLKTASYSTLLRHPYLSGNDVKKILQLRKMNSEGISIEELAESKYLEDSIITKVIHYFE